MSRPPPPPETSAYGLVEHQLRPDGPQEPPILLLPLENGGTRSYADGGLVEEGEGDLGVGRIERGERIEKGERRRRDKGKGRMSQEQHDHAAGGGRGVEDEEGDFPPAVGDDEAREEKRVADNLAQWSRAEKKRRQSLRKASTLVLPSPPISGAALTSLSRRGSALIRGASSRRSNSIISTLSPSPPPLPTPPNSSEFRRSSRRASIRLSDREGGSTSSTDAHLPDLVEEDDPSSASIPLRTTSPTSFSHTTTSDEPRPATIRAAHTSRFIEHLPSQTPTSPPAKRSSAALSHAPTRSGSPTFAGPEYGISSSTLAGPDYSSSPPSSTSAFADVVQPRRPGGMVKRASERTVMSLDSTTTERGEEWIGGGGGEESTRGLMRGEEEGEEGSTRGLIREGGFADAGRRYGERTMGWRDGEDEGEEVEEEVDDVGGLGVLDWLLCGCWKNLGVGEEGEGEQRGRTNPNE